MSPTALLALSILALAGGPPLSWAAERWRSLTRLTDGFVLVAVGALVVLHVLPHAVETAGWAAVVAALVGLALPLLAEQRERIAGGRGRFVVALLAVGGLAMHAIFDGVAVAGAHGHGEHEGGEHLAVAVVAHRLTVGLAVWWVVRGARGPVLAWGLLALLMVATLVGFAFAEPVVGLFGDHGADVLQALVAGALLHVVVHGGRRDVEPRGRWQIAETLGGALGLLTVILIPEGAGHGEAATGDAWRHLLELALASAPLVLGGLVAAGVIYTLLPETSARWIGRGGTWQQAARGTVAGFPVPTCSCGIVPRYEAFVAQGVAAPAALAFLVATPEIGIEAILLSYVLLGPELTIIRLVAAVAIALVVGALVGRSLKRRAAETTAIEPIATPPGVGARLRAVIEHGFGHVVADTAPWILLGLGVGAIVHTHQIGAWLQDLPWGVDVLVFAAAGVPMYVCASAATPIAAAAILVGVSPGAALAFLFSGPATNVGTFRVLSALHSRRHAFSFGALLLSLSVGLGLVANAILPPITLPLTSLTAAEGIPWWRWGALALVALAIVGMFLRLGPRAVVDMVIHFGRQDDDHDHDHDHGHAHGHGHHHDH